MKTSGVSCETKFGLLFFWDTLLYIEDPAEVVENTVDNFLVLLEKCVLFFLHFVLLNNH